MSKKTESRADEAQPALTFEQSLAELEAIIRDLEDGRLGLDESLGRYEAGVRLLKHCHAALNQAERKIQLLTGVDENGNPVTEPFEDAAMTLEEKKETRSRRRSSGTGAARGDREGSDEPADRRGSGSDLEGGGDVDRQKGLF